MIGYTAGVWDLFHVGHLRMLQRVRGLCDMMIVGVSTDELVKEIKNKTPVIPFEDRMEILRGLEWIDAVVPQHDYNKYNAWLKMKYDKLFIGDDHYEEPKWSDYQVMLDQVGVEVVYLPYTKRISTTWLKQRIHDGF